MSLRPIAMVLLLAAVQARAQPAVPVPGSLRQILTPPPVQWDNAMLSFRPAVQQTATDFANLTGGLAFGMSPDRANAKLPDPYPGLSWDDLPLANEYPGEVRYFGVPMDRAGPLRMDLTACAGAGSYIALLFNPKGLFRLSYRLIADKTCPGTDEAAREIFAKYVQIGQSVANSGRYVTGKTQVVDVTDPTAGFLSPVRWHQVGN